MSEVKIGGAVNSSLAMVTADQRTIVGNGTQTDPLRAAGGGTSFVAQYDDPGAEVPFVGMAVVATTGTPAFGVARVIPAVGGLSVLPEPRPFCVGLISELSDDGGLVNQRVVVQFGGRLTLTPEQWNVVTGEVLVSGATYYLSVGFDNFGELSRQPASVSGQFTAPAGIALNATTMQLLLPAVPVEFP